MQRINTFYNYYFFLPDDEDKLLSLVKTLSARPFPEYSGKASGTDIEPDIETARYRFLSVDDLQILVLKVGRSFSSNDEARNWLKKHEENAGLGDDNLLGKVLVLLTPAGKEADALETSGTKWREIRFAARNVELIRFFEAGFDYDIVYRAQINPNASEPAYQLFENDLPTVEAYLAKIRLLTSVYHDSARTVLEEAKKSGRKLSGILHTQFGTQHSGEPAIQELEGEIHELSASYGKLVASQSFLSEGKSNLQGVLENLKQHLKTRMNITPESPVVQNLIDFYQGPWKLLDRSLSEVQSSIQNHQAAIEVVRGRIEILMSRESASLQSRIRDVLELNTSLQKQSLTFQVAASFIEFIVLAYYTHSLWKNLAPGAYAGVAKGVQFLLVSLFAGIAVYGTHLIAERIQGDHHVDKPLKIVLGALVLILAIIIGLSIAYSGHAAVTPH
ncbi:MAG: hypothetical protein HPY90_03815 [Syntrophothermus sp.]|uniref:hypothetical protein n=1 Tax=Syntrophothermus sp. TaxID=2736299 RepID=UPI00257C3427|nr:hypothetical protein [Syntrophothermus sp.]NSW82393.1 hypothetical protein [Syntrophothermus sp.]